MPRMAKTILVLEIDGCEEIVINYRYYYRFHLYRLHLNSVYSSPEAVVFTRAATKDETQIIEYASPVTNRRAVFLIRCLPFQEL